MTQILSNKYCTLWVMVWFWNILTIKFISNWWRLWTLESESYTINNRLFTNYSLFTANLCWIGFNFSIYQILHEDPRKPPRHEPIFDLFSIKRNNLRCSYWLLKQMMMIDNCVAFNYGYILPMCLWSAIKVLEGGR